MSANTAPRWAYYQSHIYQVVSSNISHAVLLHPQAAPGQTWVNVALNGRPTLIPAMVRLPLAQVDFCKGEPAIAPLPAEPILPGLQVGSRCEWGTSLAGWVVLAITGDTAKIRQVRGYAQAMVLDAPVAELSLLNQPEVHQALRLAEVAA